MPFTPPDDVALDYEADGTIADITEGDCIDAELERDAEAAWRAFHPGGPLPPKGSAADFNRASAEFDAALEASS